VGQPDVDDSGAPTAAPNALLHEASLKTETREVPARTAVELPSTVARSTENPANAAKPANSKSVQKPGLAAAQSTPMKAPAKKVVDKLVVVISKPVTKPLRLAKVDPLAPLPARHSATSKDSTADR
jgi:hypothetical protein